MKYSVLFGAVAVALFSSATLAAPRLSGTLKAELLAESSHRVDRNTSTNTVVLDEKTDRPNFYGTSRLKFSGSEKINDKITAAYSLEYEFYLDSNRTNSRDEDDTVFRSRSTYASLEHKDYGRIRYGRITSPETDFDTAVALSGLYGAGIPFGEFAPRTNNTIQYYTPYFGKDKKTRIKLHYNLDENNDTDRSVRTTINGRSTTVKHDMAVAQILHKGDTFQWGGSYTRAGDDFNALTGMVGYTKDDKLFTNLVLRQADYNSADNEFGAFVSASYLLDNDWQVYGQAGYVENFRGQKDTEIINGALGVSKNYMTAGGRATLFAEVAADNYDTTTTSSGDTITREVETIGAVVGMHYRF